MPRRTGPSESSYAHLPNQFDIAQGNAPVTRALPEQNSASPPSGQRPAARQGRNSIRALRLRNQLRDAEHAANAREWGKKIEEYFEPIVPLEIAFHNALKKALEDLRYFERWEAKTANDPEKELLKKLALDRLDRSIERYEKAVSDFDKDTIDKIKRINSALESFDSLPEKASLYAIDPVLEKYVEDVKARLAECREEKALALHGAIRADTLHALYARDQLVGKCTALRKKMLDGDYSDSIRSNVERVMAEFDKLTEDIMTILARGNEQLEACGKLLVDPYLHEKLKFEVRQYQNSVLSNKSALSIQMAGHTERKLQLLMILAEHDNKEQQRYENLKEWHESIKSLVREYRSVVNVHFKLIHEEKNEYLAPGKLSQETLSIRVQAATEVQSQSEKIIRACGKRAAEYENLTRIVKDERLPLLLKELAGKVAGYMRNREYAAQMWADKFQELESKKSGLASFLPQGSSSQTLHRTKEGVVLGRINRKGGLDGLDETGNVISTYFKDPDSGNWVRDYGDESDPAASAQALAPAAIERKTAAREKAGNLVQKARNIVEASARFSRKVQADVAATRDYDDKIGFLHRAFSDKAKAIAKVSDALVELEEAQAGESSGEDLSAILKDGLERLREEKHNLDVQLRQTQQDMNSHLHKRRDPTESGFRFLWEQGQVASIGKELNRRQSYNNTSDWLDRYVISFTKGPQGEEYEPWVVHAHYDTGDTDAPDVSPVRVHMKRHAEKEWGTERQAYHSRPLSEDTFKLLSST